MDLNRAVDLSGLRADGTQHRWVMVFMYSVAQAVMGRLIETHFNGGEYVLNFSPNDLLGRDGPGCAKCGTHWLSGWQTKCEITDAEYARRGSPVVTEPFVRGDEAEAEFGVVGKDGTVERQLPQM